VTASFWHFDAVCGGRPPQHDRYLWTLQAGVAELIAGEVDPSLPIVAVQPF
jgi:hypothetical protein